MTRLKYYDGQWRFSGIDRGVVLFGTLVVAVCSERHPRRGAYAIKRVGEEDWIISPAVFDGELFVYDAEFPVYHLTGAPGVVNEMIDELVHPES